MTQRISVITAFSTGLLSFFAPCILPLIPPYFAWLLGVSPEDIKGKKIGLRLLPHSFFLVLGFSLIFILLGASASGLGSLLINHRLAAQRIGGLIIIIFGLEFAGFSKIFEDRRTNLVKKLFSKLNSKTNSFLVGLTFAFAWVACFSPILGSILILSSFEKTLGRGVLLLSFYSLGLAIPFLLTSLFLGFVIEKVELFTKAAKWVNLLSGLILIVLGILLVSDYFYKIVSWLNTIY